MSASRLASGFPTFTYSRLAHDQVLKFVRDVELLRNALVAIIADHASLIDAGVGGALGIDGGERLDGPEVFDGGERIYFIPTVDGGDRV